MAETGIEGETPGDEMDYETAIAHLRAKQNFGLAALAGVAAALAGAAVWAGFVYVTHYELGLIAIAIGALAGFAVRIAGQGVDQQFGILGAACAGLGCVLGMMMAGVAMMAQFAGVGFFEALTTMGLDNIVGLTIETSSPMDLLFVAIALYEGYRFAFRPIG